MRTSLGRRVAASLITGISGITGAVVVAQPAQAADVWVHVTTYYKGWAMGTCYVRKSPGYYDYAEAQDDRADGIGFYCRFKRSDGKIIDVSDPDGYGGSNGILDLTATPYYIKEMQAVSRNTSASAWTPTGA